MSSTTQIESTPLTEASPSFGDNQPRESFRSLSLDLQEVLSETISAATTSPLSCSNITPLPSSPAISPSIAAASILGSPTPQETQATQILIVEDGAADKKILERLLNSMYSGINITWAKDGAEGLEHVGKQKFHLIFMDTSMPRLKGPEATKHIREAQNPFMETTDEQVQENRKYNSTIPIISISSEVSEEDRLRYKQVGMNACFPKPFMRKNLKSVISGVGVELQERSGATTPLSSSLSSPRSLLSPTTALTRSLSEG